MFGSEGEVKALIRCSGESDEVLQSIRDKQKGRVPATGNLKWRGTRPLCGFVPQRHRDAREEMLCYTKTSDTIGRYIIDLRRTIDMSAT